MEWCRSLGGDLSQRYKSLRVGGTARQGPGMGQEPGRVHSSGRVRHLGRCKSLGCEGQGPAWDGAVVWEET